VEPRRSTLIFYARKEDRKVELMTRKMSRVGDVMENLISGRKEAVVSVTPDGVEMADGKMVPYENLDLYRFLKNETSYRENPALSMADVAIVEHGISVRGRKINFGRFVPYEIVAVRNDGTIIVAVNDGENKRIVTYYPEMDRVSAAPLPVTAMKILKVDGHLTMVLSTREVRYTVTDEAGTKAEKTADNPSLTVLYDGEIVASSEEIPATDDVQLLGKEEGGDVSCFIYLIRTGQVVSEDTSDDDEVVTYTAPAEDGKNRLYELVITLPDDPEGHVSGDLEEVPEGPFTAGAAIFPVYGQNQSLMVADENRVVFTNRGYRPRVCWSEEAVDAVMTHPHMIPVEVSPYEFRFKLADESGETVCFTMKQTKDRGTITSRDKD